MMEEERLFLQFFFLVGCCLLLVLLGNRMYYDLNIPIESPVCVFLFFFLLKNIY